jgi:hypothetical protein
MKAAQNTINFAKEWVTGTYTKRQYQNYYTVKTPYAQFLLKLTDDRKLLAIKDNSGHIYLFHRPSTIESYPEIDEPSTGCRGYPLDHTSQSNPFLCLLAEGFQFEHTSVDCGSAVAGTTVNDISQWRTVDRIEIKNESLPMPVYLSLIAIGSKLYYLYPKDILTTIGKEYSLQEWADNVEERLFKFPNKWPIYTIATLQSNTVKKVNEIKESYLTVAGNKAKESLVTLGNDQPSMCGWVSIPTDFKTVEEITGSPFREAKKTRPTFYSYDLPAHLLNGDTGHTLRRFETMEENPLKITEYITIRKPNKGMSWRDTIRNEYYPGLAEAVISFFEADDAWLREHFEIPKAEQYERRARRNLSTGQWRQWEDKVIYVRKEPNPSIVGDYAIYFKDKKENTTFTKLLPAPFVVCSINETFNANY